jgi:cellulose 1,4-beta-cellobiosidase
MMVWLKKLGPVQPAGSKVASGVNIGGRTYDVWKGGGSPGGTVSYVLTGGASSVTNLDLGPLAADSVARGYMTDAWWLIDVEYGFEPWQGGQGLTLNAGSICTPAGC